MENSFETTDFLNGKHGVTNLGIGLFYHSTSLSQPQSRDTVPLQTIHDNQFLSSAIKKTVAYGESDR
jgi:hypothetical protein